MQVSKSSQTRIAVFGDSIAEGVGAMGRSFPALISEALEAELIDLSASACQIGASLGRADKARGCQVALVSHGATEALLRPSHASLRLVPKRWRRPGWLDPRPYFSSRRGRRLLQRAESALRWRVKILLMRVLGTTQWTRPDEYEAALMQLVESLRPTRVLILSTLFIDKRYFPGSDAEVKRYARIGREVAAKTGATFVDVSGTCRKWSDFCDDHFHPNSTGHQRIAECVLAAINETKDSDESLSV